MIPDPTPEQLRLWAAAREAWENSGSTAMNSLNPRHVTQELLLIEAEIAKLRPSSPSSTATAAKSPVSAPVTRPVHGARPGTGTGLRLRFRTDS